VKIQKTNVARILDARNIEYTFHTYEHKDKDPVDGVHVANMLGLPVEQVFKTLVTEAPTDQHPFNHYVFVIPADKELNVKKAAQAAGVKALEMMPLKKLTPLTGYVHGGCSPVGMKKVFPTFIHETAPQFDTVYVSAGKVGYQIELSPSDLISVANCKVADIVVEDM
jgi:Cys-tRNA(Pro)/Cys-tRNA(Cys) deacylase